jgi:hypothetical protein
LRVLCVRLLFGGSSPSLVIPFYLSFPNALIGNPGEIQGLSVSDLRMYMLDDKVFFKMKDCISNWIPAKNMLE